MTGKRCTRCERVLPFDAFNRDRRTLDGRNYWCRPCQSEVAHAWYLANRARKIAASAAWKAAHPDEARRHVRQAKRRARAKVDASTTRRSPHARVQHEQAEDTGPDWRFSTVGMGQAPIDPHRDPTRPGGRRPA